MMIFVVLNTAASFIQAKYREYLERKRAKLTKEEELKSSEVLSETAKLEDRFLPVLKDLKQRSVNKRSAPSD